MRAVCDVRVSVDDGAALTDVGLNLSIDQFYVNNAMIPFDTKDIVWEFSKIEMIIQNKPNLTSDSFSSKPQLFTKNDSMLYTSANPCTQQSWTAVGKSANTFVLGNWTDFLFVYSTYADNINYADFERPALRITAKVYAVDKGDKSCDESKGKRVRVGGRNETSHHVRASQARSVRTSRLTCVCAGVRATNATCGLETGVCVYVCLCLCVYG